MSKIQLFRYEKGSANSVKDTYLMLSIYMIILTKALTDW